MARLNDLAHGKLDAPKLDPRDIIVREGFNYRDMTSEPVLAHIAWLKESIRERGVDRPIHVEFINGEVYLVDGQCRLEACNQLRAEGVEIFIPALAVKGDEAEILAKSMAANGGLPPTKLEFGAAAARLMKYGWSEEQVAKYTPPHVGQKKRYVREAVELHEAPLAVKAAVAAGTVSPALALQAIRDNRATAPTVIAQAITESNGEVVKRAKAPTPTKALPPDEELLAKISALRDDTAAVDLHDATQNYIEVDRKLLLNLFQYAETLV